jgi:hypothetical protein
MCNQNQEQKEAGGKMVSTRLIPRWLRRQIIRRQAYKTYKKLTNPKWVYEEEKKVDKLVRKAE